MNTAILFTGNYRTFEKTYHLIHKNIIETNNAKIFVYCECEYSTTELISKITQKIGTDCIGSIIAVKNSKTPEYDAILDFLIKNRPALQHEIFASASIKDKLNWNLSYVYNSGTIIQYYQFMQCFKLMQQYERINNIKFDICVRSRLDIVISTPLYLNDFFTNLNTNTSDNIEYYIRSLGNSDICNELLNGKQSDIIAKYTLHNFDNHNITQNNLLNHINNHDYIWTIGIEQIWIAKRHVFNYLQHMVYCYGSYIHPNVSCPFNSESFFVQHINALNIKQFIFSSNKDVLFNDGDYELENGYVNKINGFMSIIR